MCENCPGDWLEVLRELSRGLAVRRGALSLRARVHSMTTSSPPALRRLLVNTAGTTSLTFLTTRTLPSLRHTAIHTPHTRS